MTPLITSSSHGMTLADVHGKTYIDLIAGLASCLGHRHPAVCEAMRAACDSHLGAPLDRLPEDWHHALGVPFVAFDHCHLTASANDANELALRLARTHAEGDRYRVITLLGSDHGDTLALRSASGRAAAQRWDGPVAAGYRHVVPGDAAAIEKVIDENTAAICLSPVDWNRGGEALDTEYLVAIELLCREHGLLLVMDETRVPPGVGGSWFFHQRAEVAPDIVTASAGWTGGLPGACVLFGARVSDKFAALGPPPAAPWLPSQQDMPLLRMILTATARTLTSEQLLHRIGETADAWAAMLDEAVAGFDFIRGCVSAGLWTTIELDLPAIELADTLLAAGLRLQATGDTTVLICPPVNATGESLLDAIQPLRDALESIERATTSS